MKVVLLMALAAALTASQQLLPPPAKADGLPASIYGQITDKTSGAPIPRAVVVVRRFGPLGTLTQRTTDREGRFEIRGLVAGQYHLTAASGEFKASHVPYQPVRMSQLDLKPGERRELAIVLERALAISGRVVDEAGLPLSGVRVDVLDPVSGETRDLVFGGSISTDDRGNFRAYGLPAGRYIVCANGDSFPRFQVVVEPRRSTFVRTCYPSEIDESLSPRVALRDGGVEGVEIRMRRTHTFSISGIVTTANGSPAESFTLGFHRLDGRSGSSHNAHGGRFTISNVSPGRYFLTAEIRDDPSSSVAREKASRTIDVTSDDIDGIVVAMREGATVRGAVTFEEGPSAELANLQLIVHPRAVDPSISAVPPGRVEPDLSFQLTNLFGRNVLTLARLPPGYIVRSILYRGSDIADIPTEFDGDPGHSVEIVVSRRGAEVSGRVVDERGNPAAAALVYMYPVDPRKWERFMRGDARSATDGSYRLRNLVPGDYLVVAISDADRRAIERTEWYRSNQFERLAEFAERVSLLESDRRVIDLQLTAVPQEWKR